jgi:hypothetical protein
MLIVWGSFYPSMLTSPSQTEYFVSLAPVPKTGCPSRSTEGFPRHREDYEREDHSPLISLTMDRNCLMPPVKRQSQSTLTFLID